MTSFVIKQPGPIMESKESNQWSSGICDCTNDMAGCCFACWCGPCHACLHSREYGECLCLPLLDMFGFVPPITMSMRVSMRQRYGIKGTFCNDCVHATCCRACVWCQMSREMKGRKIPVVLTRARNTMLP
ncbi:cornifelin homolog B-like [Esox lucius]|uniref:Cornifelin homolog B n=1 Tax=Esox lucius TaxID=8010 RepID=C1BX47_ESOLU|nr:cornifelin homolog B-like [Esox lucius]ACO13600.1 Cornifelin homolog B [Esox lucius]